MLIEIKMCKYTLFKSITGIRYTRELPSYDDQVISKVKTLY